MFGLNFSSMFFLIEVRPVSALWDFNIPDQKGKRIILIYPILIAQNIIRQLSDKSDKSAFFILFSAKIHVKYEKVV